MLKENSKYLVIDASVFKAAGEKSPNVISINCRELLTKVMTICHKVEVSDLLNKEIKKHSSKFSRKWRTAMTSKKKYKISNIDSHHSNDLDSLIESLANSKNIGMEMKKDAHLLIAANRADKIIISLDDRAKSNFQSIIDNLNDYKEIMWVNPKVNIESTVEWLRKGAKPDKKLMLKGNN